MTQKSWTTPEQAEWLKAHCKNFAEAEANNSTKAFYDEIYVSWLKAWPNPEPTAAEVEAAGGQEQAVKKKLVWQDNMRLPTFVLWHRHLLS